MEDLGKVTYVGANKHRKRRRQHDTVAVVRKGNCQVEDSDSDSDSNNGKGEVFWGDEDDDHDGRDDHDHPQTSMKTPSSTVMMHIGHTHGASHARGTNLTRSIQSSAAVNRAMSILSNSPTKSVPQNSPAKGMR